MGEEGRPGKKIKVKGRVKRPDRPPENPVVDVSPHEMFTALPTSVFSVNQSFQPRTPELWISGFKRRVSVSRELICSSFKMQNLQ